MRTVRWVGLDVHADSIAVAVAEDRGEVRTLGTIPHEPGAVRRLVKRLGPPAQLRACYEAGPTGYGLYWQLTALGVRCEVIAPTLVPVRPGDRVKTDRRDAALLARCYRAGDLTPVWVPDAAHEALRDLVRAREAAKKDQHRARQRLSKFLLRRSQRPPAGVKAWTQRYLAWVRQVTFAQAADEAVLGDYLHEVDHAAARVARLEDAIRAAVATASPAQQAVVAALQAVRGIALVSAVTLVAEVGEFRRFRHARQVMSYAGATPSEHSSGRRVRRGGLTKAGNAHVRRILMEAAWHARYRPHVSKTLRRRQAGLSPTVCEWAWRAQVRLHGRMHHLLGRGKPRPVVAAAIGRELLGFLWSIAVHVEQETAA